MNKSKQNVQKERAKKKTKQSKGAVGPNKIVISVFAVFLIAIIGIITFESFYKPALVTIDGTKYRVNDVATMYHLYQAETNTEQISNFYAAYSNGTDYWNMDGVKTNGLNGAMSNLIQTEVLYKEATKNNVTLTEEEKKEVDQAVEQMNKMSSYRKRKTGYSEESFKNYIETVFIADKYKKQLIEGYGVKAEDVKDKVDASKYEEYKIQYIATNIKKVDENNKTVDLPKEEIDKKTKQLESYVAEAKAGKDFTKLVDEDNKDYSYAETTFIKGSETLKAIQDEALKLKNGEYSGVVKSDTVAYVIKMVDTKCKDAYNAAVEEEVTKAEESKFKAALDKLKIQYGVKLNTSAIDKLKFGSLTLKQGAELEEFRPEATNAPSTNPSATPTASENPDEEK